MVTGGPVCPGAPGSASCTPTPAVSEAGGCCGGGLSPGVFCVSACADKVCGFTSPVLRKRSCRDVLVGSRPGVLPVWTADGADGAAIAGDGSWPQAQLRATLQIRSSFAARCTSPPRTATVAGNILRQA